MGGKRVAREGRVDGREKRRDEEERKKEREEGGTVTLGLPHLWAYHLACRGKITVPVAQRPE